MNNRSHTAFAAVIASALALGACATDHAPANRSLYSVNQPVVEHRNFTLDLATAGDSLPLSEQRRLYDWFETLNLAYGDRVALDGAAGAGVEDDVAAIAGRYGLLVSEGAPITDGQLRPGMTRVVVTRAHAYVPGCPDWGSRFAPPGSTETKAGYGCSINGNLAAMVADPEHLLHGATGSGETVVMSSTKAIATYRAQEPTGKAGLPAISTQTGK